MISTRKNYYISLYSALNVPCPSGNTGDWHPIHLDVGSLNVCGEGCEVNTHGYFSDFGIYDLIEQRDWSVDYCEQYWGTLVKPVYVANHVRAALDLLYVDFILDRNYGRGTGRSVDMYAWIDSDDDLQLIMDRFKPVIDEHGLNEEWTAYCDWIWEHAE